MRHVVLWWLLLMATSSAQIETLAVLHVDRTGYCEVRAEELPEACLGRPAGRLALRRRDDLPVGLTVVDSGDGTLGPGDRLHFFGQGNTSVRTAQAAYHLVAGAAPVPLPETTWVEAVSLSPRLCFGALPTSDLEVLDEAPPIDHWFVCQLPPEGKPVQLPLLVPGGHPELAGETATVRLVLQGGRHHEARNQVSIQVTGGGTSPVLVEWEGAEPRACAVEVPTETLRAGEAGLTLRNLNPRQRFNLVGTNLDEVYVDQVRLEAHVEHRLADAAWTRPTRISQPFGATRKGLLAGGGDYLVITRQALVAPLAPLLEWRRRQGLHPRVVLLQEIFEAYRGSEFDPEAIRLFLRDAAEHWEPAPRYFLLVGDADRDSDRPRPFESMPTCIVEICGDGGAASDVAYALLDDDPFPDVAVGRFPAHTPEELTRLVEGTVRYERDLPPGVWRRQVALILGEGRFGARADQALEQVATSMVGTYIPAHFDVSVTFASPGSPYVVPPERFNQMVINRINAGPAVVAYVGHGSPRGLDRLRWGKDQFPILTSQHAPLIDCGPGRPVMFVIACSTGHLDDPRRRCIAEDLLLQPRGPVALVAASRVSYPYPNAILAKEVVNVFLRQGEPCLGDGLDSCRRLLEEGRDPYRQMIDMGAASLLPRPELMQRERRDQILLYNLLGDPALRMALPRGRIALRAPAQVERGDRVQVLGAVVGPAGEPVPEGQALVTLEILRTSLLHELEPIQDLTGENRLAAIARNYERANDKVAASVSAAVSNGTLTVQIVVPEGIPEGEYLWKVHVAAAGGDAATSGSVRVGEERVSPPPDEDDEEEDDFY